MKVLVKRASGFLGVVFVLTVLTLQGANAPSQMARATLADGTTEIVRIDGVGCSESLCSTVLMKAKTSANAIVAIRFDSIAAIRDIHPNDAVFVGRDGTERRLNFVSDFRVFYVSKSGGTNAKIDLAKIKSLEFLGIDH